MEEMAKSDQMLIEMKLDVSARQPSFPLRAPLGNSRSE